MTGGTSLKRGLLHITKACAGDDMKAVIPAAGLGTRFFPITKAQPKEMLPVYNKPVIQYVVEEIIASGIDDILIVTGKNKRAIEDHFDRSPELENILSESDKQRYLKEVERLYAADIHYTRQKEQRGLGDAIYSAMSYVGDEPFAVLLGDTITMDDVPCTRQMIEQFNKVKSTIIAVERVPRDKISSYGIVDIDVSGGNLVPVKDLVEKPAPEEAASDYGIIGRYILTPEIFSCIEETKPGKNGEMQLTDALNLLKEREPVYAYVFKGKRYDIGNMLDWLKSTVEIALMDESVNPELKRFLEEVLK